MNDMDCDTFLAHYIPQAEIFLRLLEEKEKKVKEMDINIEDIKSSRSRPSTRMRESIHDRSAWFIYACRKVL